MSEKPTPEKIAEMEAVANEQCDIFDGLWERLTDDYEMELHDPDEKWGILVEIKMSVEEYTE